jgi:uncharacterized protein involved in outer membrane biogenesis
MKWLKLGGVMLLVLALGLAAVPYFVSLDDHVPRIEREASARLNEPVTIGGIRLAAWPRPHVIVEDVTLGKAADIKLGRVTVIPDLLSLLGETKVLRSLLIDGLELTPAGIGRLSAWGTQPGEPKQPQAVRITDIRLDRTTLKLEQTTLGPFDLRLSLSGAGDLAAASLATRDGGLLIKARPEKAGYVIEARARHWTLPVGPEVRFDELVLQGLATASDVNFSSVQAKLYDGTVDGQATIAWQKGLQIEGALAVDGVELESLVPLFAPESRMTGKLNARPVVTASARSFDELLDALHVKSPFNVQDGVIYGVDVGKAATSFLTSKQGASGGQTRFDELAGQLVLERGAYRFTGVKVVSGSLSAEGYVTISPKQELSGRINAKAKASKIASATVPLNVSGTVQSPVLFPTGATMAGAAVGTAVMGPGVGTAIGTTIGSGLSRLFGRGGEEEK